MKRLDVEIVDRRLLATRSQALNYIKLGKIKLNGQVCQKPAKIVGDNDNIEIFSDDKYVSRAGFKLASVAKDFNVKFEDKIVLDVGSSTGGFSDFSLQNGAKKVYAVDVGTSQLHPKIRSDYRVEVYEKTDIRNFVLSENDKPDIILIDVSFVSVRQILPHIERTLSKKGVQIILMLKPQFEAHKSQLNKGIIKNKTYRRQIIKDFENYVKSDFKIVAKKDSEVAGKNGNIERFYLLENS